MIRTQDSAQALRAAKKAARAALRDIKGVEGVGMGDGTVRVYVSSESVCDEIPKAFEGFPTECVVTGEISLLAAPGRA